MEKDLKKKDPQYKQTKPKERKKNIERGTRAVDEGGNMVLQMAIKTSEALEASSFPLAAVIVRNAMVLLLFCKKFRNVLNRVAWRARNATTLTEL